MSFKKILKNPIHEARKLRLDLHRTGNIFKNMAKDPTVSIGERIKYYTYGDLAHGLRNIVKHGTKAIEVGTNKFKDAYDSSTYVKREVGNIIINNPVKTTLGGLAAIEGGRQLLKDNEDFQLPTTNLSESENMLANKLKQLRQSRQSNQTNQSKSNIPLQESSYSEPKEGTFYDKVFNSKKTVPDNPDNSSVVNLTSKTADLRYRSEKDTDKEVEEIPTQGGEEPQESLNENQSEMSLEESELFNLHSKFQSILEAVHTNNPELDKNGVWTAPNRNKLAKDLKSLRKIRDKERKRADLANSSEVKDWRNKTANTADNLARRLSSTNGDTQVKTSPLTTSARAQYGNFPRIVKTIK